MKICIKSFFIGVITIVGLALLTGAGGKVIGKYQVAANNEAVFRVNTSTGKIKKISVDRIVETELDISLKKTWMVFPMSED